MFAHLLFPAAMIAVAAAVLLPSAARAQPPPQWRWPLPGDPEVVRGFDPPDMPWGAGHRGVDLAAYPGEPVYAAGTGRIGYVGHIAGRGIVTVIHGDLRTTYLPVQASVHAGDRVKAGGRIGTIEPGFQHCLTQVCLHWGLLRGKTYLDPLSLLPRSPIRLLPLTTPLPGFPQFAGAARLAAVPLPFPSLGGTARPSGTARPVTRTPIPRPASKPVSELARSALAGTGGAGLVLLVLAAAGRGTRRRQFPESSEGQRATAMHYHPAGGRGPHSGSITSADTSQTPETSAPEADPNDPRTPTSGVPLLTAIRPAGGGRHRKLCRLRRLLAHLRRRRTPKPPEVTTGTPHAVVIDLDAERRIRRPTPTNDRDPA